MKLQKLTIKNLASIEDAVIDFENGPLSEESLFLICGETGAGKTTLLDALRSPLFQAYHDNQPFNENMLRPCPMLENAGRIQELVKQSKAVNTDYESPEDVDHLLEKTVPYAKNWKPMADKLWDEQKK